MKWTCICLVWPFLTPLGVFTIVSAQTSSNQKINAPKASVDAPSRESFEEISAAASKAKDENRDDDAIALYEHALRLKQDWKEGWWFEGVLQFGKQRYPETRDLMRRLVALEPKAGPAWALLGMSEYETKDYSRALEHLQHAREMGSGEEKELAQSVYFHICVLLTRFQRYDDASTLLFGMAKSGYPAADLQEPIGLAVLRLPFLPQEIPGDRREMIQLAGQAALAVAGQRHDDADKLFASLVAKYPDEPGVHFIYGTFLMDQRPDDGMREMRRELEISPSSVPARLRIAEQCLKEEKSRQALALAQEAIALEPTSSSARLILGEALLATGDSARGITELEKARDQAPERVRTHWDLLRAYTAAGRPEDAKREKDAIEKLNTQYPQP